MVMGLKHQKHREKLLKQFADLHLNSFWFSRSEAGPSDLHFNKFPADTEAADLGPHFENHRPKKLVQRITAVWFS